MVSIQAICEAITNRIEKELTLEIQQIEVIRYGLFAIIQTSISILASILFGLLFGVLIPALIISFVAVLLRKYSGGAHSQTPEGCAVIGTVISVGGAYSLSCMRWNIQILLSLGSFLFLISIIIVYRLAPVDSKAKPIRKAEKKQKLKKRSIFILSSYLLIVVVMLYLDNNTEYEDLLLYIACILGGIGWQVFTLTSWGHLTIAKVDLLFNKLLKK